MYHTNSNRTQAGIADKAHCLKYRENFIMINGFLHLKDITVLNLCPITLRYIKKSPLAAILCPCVCACSQLVCRRPLVCQPWCPTGPHFFSSKMKETIMNRRNLPNCRQECMLVGNSFLECCLERLLWKPGTYVTTSRELLVERRWHTEHLQQMIKNNFSSP